LPALGLHKRSVCCSAARGVSACYTPLMDQARLIAALQDALTKHFWPEYPVIGGTVTARCHCGASIRTAEAWLEHLKTDVIPETVRANSTEMEVRVGQRPINGILGHCQAHIPSITTAALSRHTSPGTCLEVFFL